MTTAKATNFQQAEELLHSGVRKVELAYDIDGDDFFRLASYWCSRGAKIRKKGQYFVVSLKNVIIPPNS